MFTFILIALLVIVLLVYLAFAVFINIILPLLIVSALVMFLKEKTKDKEFEE